jgi:hypothetical protein
MKVYTVYLKANTNPLEDAEYIAEGFSWKAFILSFFWLLYHKLWLQGIAYVVISLVIQELANAEVISSMAETVFYIGLALYVGFAGRDFLRKKLETEGYKFVEVVIAKSIDEAEYKFIDSLIKTQKELEA